MKTLKKKNKLPRKWIKQTLFATIFALLFVVAINFINDPLWVFNHENFTNKSRLGFNERQQKTNLIYFGRHDYDSILLGNSKSTYINQNKFELGKLYNYSVSAMNIEEYEGYINFFKKVTGKNPKYIVLGIDFVTCFENEEDIKKAKLRRDAGFDLYDNPQIYIKNSTAPSYQLKHLLSYDTFIYSLRNLAMGLDSKKAVYDHENVKVKLGFKQAATENLEEKLAKIMEKTPRSFEDAVYLENLTKIMEKIKKENSTSEFVIIFLPDFMPIFTINNNKPIYDKCFGEFTRIFGAENIFNFMKLNEMTVNTNNYYDGAHFRDYIGDFIMAEISQKARAK